MTPRPSYDYPPVYSPSHSLPSSASSPDPHEKQPLDRSPSAVDANAADARAQQHHHEAFDLAPDEEDDGDVGGYARRSRARTRRSRLIFAALILFAVLVGLLAASSWRSSLAPTVKVKQHLDLDRVLNGTFAPRRAQVAWVREAGDGWFSTRDDDGNIWLEDVRDNSTAPAGLDVEGELAPEQSRVRGRAEDETLSGSAGSKRMLVNATWIVDSTGAVVQFADWKLSPDMQYLLVHASPTPIWRHSSLTTPYLYCFADNTTRPLLPADARARLVRWSTVGHGLAWVREGDLWVLDGAGLDKAEEGKSVQGGVRVTTDGADGEVFNGVYEEEVFSSPSALWFSPSGSHLAFLKLNETRVPSYQYPVYDPTAEGAEPYPEERTIRYPKPGFANPTAEAFVFSLEHLFGSAPTGEARPSVGDCLKRLDWKHRQPSDDQVLFDVAWAGAVDKPLLIIKESDRSAGRGNVVGFAVPTGDKWSNRGKHARTLEGNVVRKLDGGDGWIEQSQSVTPFLNGYIDVLSDERGYNHLAYFDAADSETFAWLTTGEWEVDGGVLAVDEENALAYFVAASPSTERHIYSASVPSVTEVQGWTANVTALTDKSVPGYFAASFSPGAGFWVEQYEGPGIPWQRVRAAGGAEGDVVRLLEKNAELSTLVADHLMPTVNFFTAVVDDYALNVKELRPPHMDETGKTKYPVLLAPYGGPGSQSVHQRFAVGWHEYLATELQYVVLVVDGRGTGFKGKAMRDPVRGKLGTFEARDQLEVARTWAGKRLYVDNKRTGIWGWSFGGYLAGKVVELTGQPGNEGVIDLGISVAPVTDWRFYDSVYTERYMLTPQANPDGYAESAISNMTGFAQTAYFLAHGSADDNVHFAHSASLIEKLTKEKVRDYQFHMYTDSNHRIQTGGAYRELHEAMTRFLRDRWGTGGLRRGW